MYAQKIHEMLIGRGVQLNAKDASIVRRRTPD